MDKIQYNQHAKKMKTVISFGTMISFKEIITIMHTPINSDI